MDCDRPGFRLPEALRSVFVWMLLPGWLVAPSDQHQFALLHATWKSTIDAEIERAGQAAASSAKSRPVKGRLGAGCAACFAAYIGTFPAVIAIGMAVDMTISNSMELQFGNSIDANFSRWSVWGFVSGITAWLVVAVVVTKWWKAGRRPLIVREAVAAAVAPVRRDEDRIRRALEPVSTHSHAFSCQNRL